MIIATMLSIRQPTISSRMLTISRKTKGLSEIARTAVPSIAGTCAAVSSHDTTFEVATRMKTTAVASPLLSRACGKCDHWSSRVTKKPMTTP